MVAIDRPSRHSVLMEFARTAAKRGTCPELQVGCAFSLNGRILVTGYNGAPAGLPHCDHESYTWPQYGPPDWVTDWVKRVTDPKGVGGLHFDTFEPHDGNTWWREGHKVSFFSARQDRPTCRTAGHAERNGIDFAARHGISLVGSTLGVTHMPCLECSRSIVNVGVTQVLYDIPYRITAGVELLRDAGVSVDQLSAPA
jgi:dCMP deaminase